MMPTIITTSHEYECIPYVNTFYSAVLRSGIGRRNRMHRVEEVPMMQPSPVMLDTSSAVRRMGSACE